LTINSDGTTSKNQIQKLKEDDQNNEYIIKGKLQDKDEQIQSLTEQFSSMKTMLESLVRGLSETKDHKQVNNVTQSLFSSVGIKEI
jgi:predicted RNase H-like nuclease (RuvC/YqgF family)